MRSNFRSMSKAFILAFMIPIMILVFVGKGELWAQSTPDDDISTPDTATVHRLIKLANKDFYEDARKSTYYSERALKTSRDLGYAKGEVRSLIALANTMQFVEPVKALDYFKRALEVSKDSSLKQLEIQTLTALANYYIKWQQYEQASKYATQVMQMVKNYQPTGSQDTYPDQYPPYGLIATIHAHQGNDRKALDIYHELLTEFRENPSKKQEIPSVLSDMGNVYYEAAKYDSARFYYLNGIDVANEDADNRSLGFLMDNMGLTYYKEEVFDKALQYQIRALAHRRQVKSPLGVVISLNNLSKTFYAIGEYDSAQLYIEESYLLCHKFGSLNYLMEATEILGKVHNKLGSHDLAYGFLQTAFEYQDSLKRVSQYQAIAGASARLSIQRQVFENEQLKEHNRTLTQLGIALGVLLLAVLASAIYMLWLHNTRKRLMEELRDINQTKDKLFSVIAHDLRGPISSLKAMLDMLAYGAITAEEFKAHSGKLNKEVGHTYFLLDNLLQWARSQLDGINAEPQSANLKKIISQEANSLNAQMASKFIAFTLEVDEGVNVWADRNQLALVVRNLLSNAIKFTEEKGQISIKAQQDKTETLLSVIDSGVGMSSDDISNLFDPKTNFSKPGANGEKGTGLGLVLVKEMVTNNHGEIWVDSQLGVGSTFFIKFPNNQSQ